MPVSGEDYDSFQRSFDEVYNLNPHVLHLGFLKLLKGSKVRARARIYHYKYTSEAPYEVLENKDISYAELLKLKNIEYVVDKYHNSGVFHNTLKYIFRQHFHSYFTSMKDWPVIFRRRDYRGKPIAGSPFIIFSMIFIEKGWPAVKRSWIFS